MLRSLTLVVLLLVPVWGRTQAPLNSIAAEEYSVYSALINSRFLEQQTTLAVIRENTEFDKRSIVIPVEFEDDLLPKTETSYILDRRLLLRVKYLLLSKEKVDALFKQDLNKGWEAYWKEYPKATGLLTLSRVGFNRDRTRAFVYASSGCGSLCGYGYYFVLEKSGDDWKIKEEKKLWIA